MSKISEATPITFGAVLILAALFASACLYVVEGHTTASYAREGISEVRAEQASVIDSVTKIDQRLSRMEGVLSTIEKRTRE